MYVYGQASGVPNTPPPPPRPFQLYGMVCYGWGGGLTRAERGRGGLVGCCWGRPGVTDRAGILHKPYASHKPYNVGRVPVFNNLNLYLIL